MIQQNCLTTYLVAEQARLYRVAYSYLHDREEALDAVQTTVCKALEHQGKLRDETALHTWVLRILIHTCMDSFRRRKRLVLVAPEELDAGSYEDPLPRDDTLARRIDALPEEVALVIRLRFYEELTLQEISDATDSPLSTVKTRLYAGLKKLRVSMEGAGGT